jgi:endonuclease/exonuclease/phosphatase family metal-dependent hydrolase
MKKSIIVILLAVLLSCAMEVQGSGAKREGVREATFSLVSWNVQTFFDGETDGSEYAEFQKSPWSPEKYRERLARLCDALKILDADVLALEEVENEQVVHDIANELPGHFSQDKVYHYAAFAKKPGTAIGCAVFSRFPILDLTVHQVDWRETDQPIAPEMRPILEAVISLGEDAPRVRLFVNHWKSKSGGEEEAAFWQSRQEDALARRIEGASGDAVVACGDFNRAIGEFTQAGGEAVELAGEFSGPVRCRAGWLFPSVAGGGSYFYQGAWEAIDHIFTAGSMTLQSFSASQDGPWVQEAESGLIPYRYVMSTGKGYSDHLPVRGVLKVTY